MVADIFGPQGIIVLVVLVVLLFGAGQLPKLARSFGEAGKEFRKAQAEAEAENQHRSTTTTPPVAVTPPVVDDKITLSRADLDALLSEREARARGEATTPPPA